MNESGSSCPPQILKRPLAAKKRLQCLHDCIHEFFIPLFKIESKVREATNDDEWGPHGGLMQEVAQYTYQYEHFPEVMGMLWKRYVCVCTA